MIHSESRWTNGQMDRQIPYPITSKLLKQCQPGSPQGKYLQSLDILDATAAVEPVAASPSEFPPGHRIRSSTR